MKRVKPVIRRTYLPYGKTVEQAVKNVGGIVITSFYFDVTPQAIRSWIVTGRVPEKQLDLFAELSGVPAQELRPDLFA